MKIYKLFTLCAFLLLYSCEKNDDQIEVVVVNNATITINGIETTFVNEQLSGNTNCDFIYLGVSNYFESPQGYVLYFDIKKNGELALVRLRETPRMEPRTISYFVTPNFNPKSSVTLSNFRYEESTNDVYFEFTGTVYNEFDNSITRTISGKIDIKNHNDIACSAPSRYMEYESNNFSFSYLFPINTTTVIATGNQRHRYFSNNGYRIDFHLPQRIGEMPIGTYQLVEDDTSLFLNLFKENGPLRANQSPVVINSEWIQYKTRGTFTITERQLEQGFTNVLGHLDLEVLDGSQVIHTISGLQFALDGD